MSPTVDGELEITDGAGNVTITADGTKGDVIAGGAGKVGTVIVRGADDTNRVRIDAAESQVTITDASGNILVQTGSQGNLRAGGVGQDGDLILKDSQDRQRVHLGGGAGVAELQSESGANRIVISSNGTITVGGGGAAGKVVVLDASGNERIKLEASTNNIVLLNSSGTTIGQLGANANLVLGGQGADGDVEVKNDNGDLTVHISGNSGDILLHNADCAEEFDLSPRLARPAPGTVVVIGADGFLHPCDSAYDRRAAGVVAGAGGYKPGIVLDRRVTGFDRVPVALAGKTYCLVDAGHGAIDIGTPLTTSATRGHTMAVADPLRGFGATIGKALARLESGRAMIPVLVALR